MPVDHDGLSATALEAALVDLAARGIRPKYIYTIPTVQNPTGAIMGEARRAELLKIAAEFPEYRENAARTKLIDTTSGAYYGGGYQDVQHRMPKITNTFDDLGWAPKVNMADALRHIYDAYRGQIAEAKGLVD